MGDRLNFGTCEQTLNTFEIRYHHYTTLVLSVTIELPGTLGTSQDFPSKRGLHVMCRVRVPFCVSLATLSPNEIIKNPIEYLH